MAVVKAIHRESNGSAGARTIATISSARGHTLSRYRATGIMKRLGLVSCQLPKHAYRKAAQEHTEIENHLNREFTVARPNQVWCGDVTYSVPRVQGKHGCLNGPRVYLKCVNIVPGGNLCMTMLGCAGIRV